MLFGIGSFERKELNLEHQSGVSRDQPSNFLVTVGVSWRTSQSGFLADAHLGDTLVPTPNDLSFSQDELEWFSTISGAVKLLAVEESANIVDGDFVSRLWLLAISWCYGFNLQGHL